MEDCDLIELKNEVVSKFRTAVVAAGNFERPDMWISDALESIFDYIEARFSRREEVVEFPSPTTDLVE